MTYNFLCRFFKPKIAAWLTAIWFGLILVAIFILSAYSGKFIIYQKF